jgi:hypothetical protein
MWITLAAVVAFSPGVIYGVRAFRRGHYLTTVALFGVVAFPMITLVGVHLVRAGRTSLRASYDSTGTTLRADQVISVLMYIGLIIFICSGLVIVRFVPSGEFDVPMTRGMQIFSPILVAFGVVVAVVGLVSARRRGGVGFVKLTPTGFDLANIVYTESGDWGDVVDVKASTETKRTRKAVVLVFQDGSEKIIDGADFYVPRGSALYWMVRHYWRHRGDRPELTDGRALDRLREGRFELDQSSGSSTGSA